jgi:Ca-activated chloride channel family protein
VKILAAIALLASLDILAQQPPFRAETRLVVVHATVRNALGELITTLDRAAFTVFENGKPQPITLFRRDDIPVSLGVLIDNSGSMRLLRSKVEAAALALARASNSEDEIFVLNFNDKARIDVPFTTDVGVLEAGIARVDAIGGTAMRDAIDVAQTYLIEHGTRGRHRRHRQRECGDARADRAASAAARYGHLRGGAVRRAGSGHTGSA